MGKLETDLINGQQCAHLVGKLCIDLNNGLKFAHRVETSSRDASKYTTHSYIDVVNTAQLLSPFQLRNTNIEVYACDVSNMMLLTLEVRI